MAHAVGKQCVRGIGGGASVESDGAQAVVLKRRAWVKPKALKFSKILQVVVIDPRIGSRQKCADASVTMSNFVCPTLVC